MKTSYSLRNAYSGIAKAYIEDETFRKRFYTYEDTSEGYARRADEVKARTFDRKKLVHALLKVNRRLGASDKTLENIAKLEQASTCCIVTGQQTGVVGGPLYTLYKASTAVKKAREISQQLGTAVVPVFWMASEDHDFEEMRSVTLIDDDKIKVLRIDKKPGTGNNNPFKTVHNYSYLKEPVGFVDNNTSVRRLLMEAQHVWKDTEFSDWCQSVFYDTVHGDETVSDWFGRIYLKLFQDEGLIVVDPLDQDLRQLGSTFLLQAIESSDALIGSVNARAAELTEMGYAPLIEPREGATGLYYLENGERLQIIHENGMYTIRENDDREAFCLEKVQERMRHYPEEFSTNVVLRPVIQDVYLPTIAYVAGPGEAAYYAQLKEVYEKLGMNMPIIMLRENYTVVPQTFADELESLEISVDSVLVTDQIDLERKWLEDRDHIDVEGLFDVFTRDFDQKYTALIDALTGVDEEIVPISKRNTEMIRQQLDYLKKKAYRFHRKNHKEELKTIQRAAQWIKPYGQIQERTLGLINILSQGGPAFITHLNRQLAYDYRHRIIMLGKRKA